MPPNTLVVEAPMTELDISIEQYRHELVPARLQGRVGVHIDDLDLPAERIRERSQRVEHVMAQMAPLPAQQGEDPISVRSTHDHSAAVRLT